MSIHLGTDLWDKSDSILSFNETNTNIVDKIQKIIGESCKNQLTSLSIQKKLYEKFLIENEPLKKSDFNFSSNVYFLTEQILAIINGQETFSDALLNEVDEIMKTKISNVKKDSKILKNEKKKLFEDLDKENQKLDSDFKRYRHRFNAREAAHLASIKAEQNKSLSRNQVENYQSVYLSRKSQYEESKSDYLATLNNFNDYQTTHYTSLLDKWGTKAQNIEETRYVIMKATITNLTELCKSMAFKFSEIGERLESRINHFDYTEDCLTLINKEKTSDVPPRDVPFKDLDCSSGNELVVNDPRSSKISNSGSDSTSSNSVVKKTSIKETKKCTRSMTRGFLSKENGLLSNGTQGGNKLFDKLFGGIRKVKEPQGSNNAAEIERLELLLSEKMLHKNDSDNPEEVETEINEIRKNLESLNDNTVTQNTSHRGKLSIFQSMRQRSLNKSIDETDNLPSNNAVVERQGRGSMRRQLEKRRSRSVTNLIVPNHELSNGNGKPVIYKSKPTISMDKIESKISHISKMKTQTLFGNYKGRLGIQETNFRSIEVVRINGPVEIVSTPAEALAIAARSSLTLSSDKELYSDFVSDDIPKHEEKTYGYSYVGSCVAIHKYENMDPSKIYLSFDIGDQFYVIQEDATNENCGWLFVEKIDRSQTGYVPDSYMDKRLFDAPVQIASDQPLSMM